jgi:hypothetical protein
MQKLTVSVVCLLLFVCLATPAAFGQRRLGPKARAGIAIGSGAALGAGVGGIFRGKKGAAIGALLGGGGTAAVYLLRNRNRDNRYYDNNRYYYRAPGNSYYGRSRGRRCR